MAFLHRHLPPSVTPAAAGQPWISSVFLYSGFLKLFEADDAVIEAFYYPRGCALMSFEHDSDEVRKHHSSAQMT